MTTKITHYDVGDLWTPQATFTVGGVNTDPTQLTVLLQDASGTQSQIFSGATGGLTGSSTPVAKTGTGVYKLNPGTSLTAPGHWYCKFLGTAGVIATEQDEAIVDPDQWNALINSTALVTLAETRDWLATRNVDTPDDLELSRCINDISLLFAEEAEREFKVFGTNPQVRVFDIDERSIWRREIAIGDCTSFTQVRILDELGNLVQTPSLSDVISLPRVRRTYEPITALRFTQNVIRLWSGLYPYVVEVTGNFGFPSVPGSVRQAVLDAVAYTMDRDVESYREDLAAGPVVATSGAKTDSLPPATMDTAISWRRELVG